MENSKQILSKLKTLYPTAKCALNHNNAWQLLMATILSAQCTDERVNKVTAEIFKKYPNVQDFHKLDLEQLKKMIYSTGFYNNKAKSIKGAAKMIMEQYQRRVPDEMSDLIKIPGVARKTANVVLSVWFKKNQGVVVDTHVKRLAFRLGLTKETDPNKVEPDLMNIYAQADWERIATLLIFHGRNVCFAKKPNCQGCVLNKICPSAFNV